MHSNIAIIVEGVSKRYRLGAVARIGLQDGIARRLRSLRGASPKDAGKEAAAAHAAPRELSGDFWALRDVSFEIKRGETVALLGANGAGKSTMLKILSRITAPTSGRIVTNGRLGTMLEVGTGFHPELTGRENVFLNGAILGMSRQEVAAKFDAIVDFSGIEKFLDTPVKRYSSGMYVRLAFAVASHLESEVLIVDEVLAVGDIVFQRKCVERMRTVAGNGRTTVIFVSHNMSNVAMLCSRALWFDNGVIRQDGPTDEVAEAYLNAQGAKGAWRAQKSEIPLRDRKDRNGDGLWRSVDAEMTRDPQSGRWIFSMRYESEESRIEHPALVVAVRRSGSIGDSVLALDSRCASSLPEQIDGKGRIEIELSSDVDFVEGEYTCDITCLHKTGGQGQYAWCDQVLAATAFSTGPGFALDWTRNPITSSTIYARQNWRLCDLRENTR